MKIMRGDYPRCCPCSAAAAYRSPISYRSLVLAVWVAVLLHPPAAAAVLHILLLMCSTSSAHSNPSRIRLPARGPGGGDGSGTGEYSVELLEIM